LSFLFWRVDDTLHAKGKRGRGRSMEARKKGSGEEKKSRLLFDLMNARRAVPHVD